MTDKKGFLLFEVIISIVIITSGLLLVMRGYSSSKQSLQKSTALLKTTILLENGMWQSEEAGEIVEGVSMGEFNDRRFSWELEAAPVDMGEEYNGETEINVVTLEVVDKKNASFTGYSVKTYLKNKTE